MTHQLPCAVARSKSAFRHIYHASARNTRGLSGPAIIPRALDPHLTARSSRHGSCAEHRSADRPSVSSTHMMGGGIYSVSGKGLLVDGVLAGGCRACRGMSVPVNSNLLASHRTVYASPHNYGNHKISNLGSTIPYFEISLSSMQRSPYDRGI